MNGLLAYGAYIPHHRLSRAAISSTLGGLGGRGTRAVASYDEDATSMAVEAARKALAGSGLSGPSAPSALPERLLFATASPPYLDKTNANVIHAALGLDASVLAVDVMGSVRSGIGAVITAAEAARPTLALLADVRTGLPGGTDEREGGVGAAALLFGPGSDEAPVVAEVVATAATTAEFLDRWREPGAAHSRVWEERFGDHAYGPLTDAAFADALKQADLTPADVDHLVVAGLHTRANRSFARSAGVSAEAMGDDLTANIGNTGTAHAGVALAAVLDRAAAGAVVAVVVLADGATVLLLRTTGALADRRPHPSVAEQVAAGSDQLPYATYLTWRGLLDREPPRRPDPVGPAAPPTYRREAWKYGFVGAKCDECGTVHLPPVRVCVSCRAVDRMAPVRMADVPATVATYTIDRLAYSPNPPIVAAIIDFDGGGRFSCELTDVDPDRVAIGDRVTMSFRRLLTAGGIHNYFWKATPAAAGTDHTSTDHTSTDQTSEVQP